MVENAKKYKDIVFRIIGAAMNVHEILHHGLLEAVYEEALSMELEDRGIKPERQKEIPIYYKGRLMTKKYKMDLVVEDVVIELKSASKICSAHRAQLCNYLRLSQKPIGILINFGKEYMQGERWFYDKDNNECILIDKSMQPVYPTEDLFGDGTEYIETEEN